MLMEPLFCRYCGGANQQGSQTCAYCQKPLTGDDEDESDQPSGFQLLNGRYRIVEQIGTGGYGAVYRAIDTGANLREVAIKCINLRGLSAQEIIEATDTYNREVALLRSLSHPNIPHVYDQFSDAEHWYVIMEFIKGETIETYVEKRRKQSHKTGLPIEEIIEIGLQLCEVLQYLHTRQPAVIFRDLKPGNIMRALYGKLYLIDFGIARRYSPNKRKDTMPLGSPGYAAPEQYGKAQTGPQADVYSLGALLHYLYTGEDPSENPFFFSSVAITGYQDSIRLDRLLQCMVEKDATLRIQNMEIVKQELLHMRPHLKVLYNQTQTQTQQQAVGGKVQKRSSLSRRTAMGIIAGVGVIAGGFTIQQILHYYNQTSIDTASQIPVTNSKSEASNKVPDPPKKEVPQVIYTYREHNDAVQQIYWSSQGKYIASGDTTTIHIWEPDSGNTRVTHPYSGGDANMFALSPDGKYIASIDIAESNPNSYFDSLSPILEIWNTQNNGSIYQHKYTENEQLYAVVWSPNQNYLAISHAISDQNQNNTQTKVEILDAKTGVVLKRYPSWSHPLAWSPDSTKLIKSSIDGTQLEIWDLSSGKITATYPYQADNVAWSPNGKYIVSTSSEEMTAHVWDASTGKELYTYHGHTNYVDTIVWSPDSKRIASGSTDNTAQVWDALTGENAVIYKGHSDAVFSVAWSPDGKYIASGGRDQTVQIWEPN